MSLSTHIASLGARYSCGALPATLLQRSEFRATRMEEGTFGICADLP